ncbi:hypothetical protein [Nocardia sp. BMG51109]|uniref:hypothetical protein n=1 Tax=Nocardia sp. BMG51109 TaxID=1056816 RepID=UPI000466C4D9|nr:hypothetical protein [Nocardia sp. BMG51109]
MDDEQIGLDISVDVEPSAWAAWADPQRQSAQTRKFLKRAGLPALPAEPWDFESDEAVEISDMIAERFPDIKDVTIPENSDLVDQLVCFTGEWFIRYLDARWCDLTDMPPGYNDCPDVTIYGDIKPAIVFPFRDWKTCTADFLVKYVVENEFLNLVELVSVAYWRLRKDDGSPSFSELRTTLPDHPPFV